MHDLEQEIKILIVQALKLEDVAAEDIDTAAPLFNEGLGLDSIDALELGVAIRQRYGIKIETAGDDIKRHFFSVGNLAAFIAAQRGSTSGAR